MNLPSLQVTKGSALTLHRSIADDHPFFDECLQFYLLTLATFAVGLHVEAQKDALRFAEIANTLYSAFKAREEDKAKELFVENSGEWDLPDYPPAIHLQSAGSDDCVLHVPQALVDFARRGNNKPTSLRFELVPKVQATFDTIGLPEAPEGFVAVDGAVPTTLFETVLAYLIGGSFERFKDHFRMKYGAVADWPSELQSSAIFETDVSIETNSGSTSITGSTKLIRQIHLDGIPT